MTSRTTLRIALAAALSLAVLAAGCGGGASQDELVIGEYRLADRQRRHVRAAPPRTASRSRFAN